MSIKPELLAGIGDKIQATLADPGSIEFFTYALTQPAIIEAATSYDPIYNPYGSRRFEWLIEKISNPLASYESIAREYNLQTGARIFRQTVHQGVHSAKTRFYNFCPPEIQAKIPRSEISLAVVRPTLDRLYKERPNLGAKLADFNANYSDEEVQVLLDQMDKSFYGYYSSGKPGGARLLIAPRQLALQRSNYFIAGRGMFLFYQTIEQARIPMGRTEYRVSGGEKAGIIQRYHFIWLPHQERVLEAWAANHDLDRFLI